MRKCDPRPERIAADELDCGLAFGNQYVRSDARLPFGGIKERGYGRELSEFGIYEFRNVKTVLVQEW
jgi:succinate-semialdehyde dehydrogenase/glutarate-semialdehyde dehydrogenase